MSVRLSSIVALALLGLASASALAQTPLAPSAPIVAVTVYPAGAEVTRRVAIEPGDGDGAPILRIPELTAKADPQSLRVETEDDHVEIASVDVERDFSSMSNQAEARAVEARIDRLKAERAALEDAVRAAERQLAMVEALIAGSAERGEEGAEPAGAAHWREMLSLVGEASAAAYERQREARRQIERLDAEIVAAENELAQLRSVTDSYTAVIALSLDRAEAGELLLSYRVGEAGWRPLYDARVDTEGGALELTQLAEVRQTTGEDWDDVRLSLGTSRPHLGGPLPRLDTWFIDLQREMAAKELRRGSAIREPAPEEDAVAAPAPAPVPLAATEFSATYHVPGRVTVPADNTTKKVRLDRHDYEIALHAQVVPAFSPVAHLVGELTHEGEAPLLPGQVSLYRDGVFVGRQLLDMLRPGETRELSLGVDERIEVERRLAGGERGSSGLIRTEESESRLYRTEVTNHHGRPLEIAVLDRMPVSRHEDIAVELLDETSPPTERDVDERKGVLAWRHEYAPGETRVVSFGYVVSFPEGARLTDF